MLQWSGNIATKTCSRGSTWKLGGDSEQVLIASLPVAVLPHRKGCNAATVLQTAKFSHSLILEEVHDGLFTNPSGLVACLPLLSGSVSDVLQHLWHFHCLYVPLDFCNSSSKVLLT